MKKLLFVVSFIFLAKFSFAQPSYGFRAAVNYSSLDFKEAPMVDNEHRNGLAFGFFAEYFMNDKFSIMPEIQYSAEGGKEEVLRANYIQAPIQLRMSLSDYFKVGIGPQIGLKTWSYEDNFRNLVFSGVAGIQYNISDSFFLDLRYNYGFTNVFDKDFDYNAKNQNFQFGIGLKVD